MPNRINILADLVFWMIKEFLIQFRIQKSPIKDGANLFNYNCRGGGI